MAVLSAGIQPLLRRAEEADLVRISIDIRPRATSSRNCGRLHLGNGGRDHLGMVGEDVLDLDAVGDESASEPAL
jgi:hypothetical protein